MQVSSLPFALNLLLQRIPLLLSSHSTRTVNQPIEYRHIYAQRFQSAWKHCCSTLRSPLLSLCFYSHPPSHSKATALRSSTKLSHTGALPGSHSGIHTHRRFFTQAHTHTGAHSHRHSFGQALSRSFSLSHCCATRFVSCCVLSARSLRNLGLNEQSVCNRLSVRAHVLSSLYFRINETKSKSHNRNNSTNTTEKYHKLFYYIFLLVQLTRICAKR